MSKAYWETLSLVEREYIRSDIKALNQRMTDLEKHGMTNTDAYKNLTSWALSLPHNVVQKTVNGQTINAVRAKQTYKVTQENVKRTTAIKNNPQASRGGEIKKIQQLFKDAGQTISKKDAEQFANRMGDLHDFIVNHTEAYYGTELHEATRRTWKGNYKGSSPHNLSLDEVNQFFKLMNDAEQAEIKNKANYMSWLLRPEISE